MRNQPVLVAVVVRVEAAIVDPDVFLFPDLFFHWLRPQVVKPVEKWKRHGSHCNTQGLLLLVLEISKKGCVEISVGF